MTADKPLHESEFYMWRAVFAFAFVDNILSMEEQEVLRSYIHNVPFSKEQLATLHEDMRDPPDVIKMYNRISREKDQEHFCTLARTLVWCEGDMDKQEAAILKKVSCLECEAGAKVLHSSRAHVHDFYQNYAKAGVVGLFKARPNLEMRV